MSASENRPLPSPESSQERLVPAQTFAERLAIRRRTLGHRVREGSVPTPIRIKGRLYWRESVVADFIRDMQK
jgi:predicted DNA-binding transcriptional regulator AlpA